MQASDIAREWVLAHGLEGGEQASAIPLRDPLKLFSGGPDDV
jgi:hypothetical protein